jgi:hypothetical protein
MNTEDKNMNNEDQQNSQTQLNLAETLRNAGRDYHEHSMSGSIKLFLTISTMAELRRVATDNSRLFRHRFGFEPSNKAVREQVLAIQAKYDYTDRDIRLLHQSGQLSISPDGIVTLKPSWIMPFVGYIQLFILSVVCAALIVHVGYSSAPAWKLMIGQVIAGAFWFGGAWALNRLYIAPWRILKRSGVVASTKSKPSSQY